jgi:hypothetical protein
MLGTVGTQRNLPMGRGYHLLSVGDLSRMRMIPYNGTSKLSIQDRVHDLYINFHNF